MSEPAKGVLAMVATCMIWGLSAIFYKQLTHVPPLEVLSHRTLWSLVFFSAVLLLQGRLGEVVHVMRSARTLALIVVAAVMISANWFLFILSIQIGRAVESSLGYYIFPLVAVLLGALALGERLRPLQWGAVAIATLAVLLLTYGLGGAPYISLVLAFTFGIYGLVKKRVAAGPVVSVTTEVLVLAPLAALWLWGVHTQGWTGLVGRNLGAFGHSWHDSIFLILSGPLTAVPLMLFSYASKRISYATQGLVQYINPTLQFLVAVLVLGEGFTGWHALAFPLIWTALALYSLEALRQDRAARRASVKAGTSPTG